MQNVKEPIELSWLLIVVLAAGPAAGYATVHTQRFSSEKTCLEVAEVIKKKARWIEHIECKWVP